MSDHTKTFCKAWKAQQRNDAGEIQAVIMSSTYFLNEEAARKRYGSDFIYLDEAYATIVNTCSLTVEDEQI